MALKICTTFNNATIVPLKTKNRWNCPENLLYPIGHNFNVDLDTFKDNKRQAMVFLDRADRRFIREGYLDVGMFGPISSTDLRSYADSTTLFHMKDAYTNILKAIVINNFSISPFGVYFEIEEKLLEREDRHPTKTLQPYKTSSNKILKTSCETRGIKIRHSYVNEIFLRFIKSKEIIKKDLHDLINHFSDLPDKTIIAKLNVCMKSYIVYSLAESKFNDKDDAYDNATSFLFDNDSRRDSLKEELKKFCTSFTFGVEDVDDSEPSEYGKFYNDLMIQVDSFVKEHYKDDFRVPLSESSPGHDENIGDGIRAQSRRSLRNDEDIDDGFRAQSRRSLRNDEDIDDGTEVRSRTQSRRSLHETPNRSRRKESIGPRHKTLKNQHQEPNEWTEYFDKKEKKTYYHNQELDDAKQQASFYDLEEGKYALDTYRNWTTHFDKRKRKNYYHNKELDDAKQQASFYNLKKGKDALDTYRNWTKVEREGHRTFYRSQELKNARKEYRFKDLEKGKKALAEYRLSYGGGKKNTRRSRMDAVAIRKKTKRVYN